MPESLRAPGAVHARAGDAPSVPYIRYGEGLVAACAAAGTDYVDLTGEPEFVDTMWVRHHEQAERSGARIVHSCGFDSIPHDLGTLFTVDRLPAGEPLTVEEFVQVGATFSGGTYHSLIHGLSRARPTMAAATQRRRLEPPPRRASRRAPSARRCGATRWGRGGRSPPRRSTSTPCFAPRGRSIATARTSATACRSSPGAPPAPPGSRAGSGCSPCSPRSRRCATPC